MKISMNTNSDNTKITLTVKQLRRLISESRDDRYAFELENIADFLYDRVLDENDNWFTPLLVTRGRKFRGKCFLISTQVLPIRGFASYNRASDYYTLCTAWDDTTSTEVTFIGSPPSKSGRVGDEGISLWSAGEEATHSAIENYVDSKINACVKRCGDDMNYRFNWLKKVLKIGSTNLLDRLVNASELIDCK